MERKDFLKKLALGIGALAIAPTKLFSKEPVQPEFKEEDFKKYEGLESCHPYIFTISNTSTESIYNIPIFNAKDSLKEKNHGAPSAVQIHSELSTLTYEQFLKKITEKSFVVGKMYLQSSNSSQCLQTMTHKQNLRNGKSLYTNIVPIINPYQNQSCIIEINHQYGLDKNTTLILNQLLPSATLSIYIFPNNPLDNPKPLLESTDYIICA